MVTLPVLSGSGPQSLAVSPGIFVDLMSHAPRLNTSAADALAVVEAEAKLSNLEFQIRRPSLPPEIGGACHLCVGTAMADAVRQAG